MTIKLKDQTRTDEQDGQNQDQKITDLMPTEAQVEETRGGINLLLPAIQKIK